MTTSASQRLAVKFHPVGDDLHLWVYPVIDWLRHGLPADEFAQNDDLPWELSRALFKSIYDFGPNGENVRLAAEELSRLIPILVAQDPYFIEKALDSSEPFELLELPRHVDDRIYDLASEVTYDMDEWIGDSVYGLLGLIALDGFILGNSTRWSKYSEKYALLGNAFAMAGSSFRWRDPNRATE